MDLKQYAIKLRLRLALLCLLAATALIGGWK